MERLFVLSGFISLANEDISLVLYHSPFRRISVARLKMGWDLLDGVIVVMEGARDLCGSRSLVANEQLALDKGR